MSTIALRITAQVFRSLHHLCVGRDADSKQVFKWYPPDELTPAKARKEAQKVAVLWEDEARQAYLKEQEGNAVAGFFPSRPDTVPILYGFLCV